IKLHPMTRSFCSSDITINRKRLNMIQNKWTNSYSAYKPKYMCKYVNSRSDKGHDKPDHKYCCNNFGISSINKMFAKQNHKYIYSKNPVYSSRGSNMGGHTSWINEVCSNISNDSRSKICDNKFK